jgi:hypothetical protein
MGEGIDAPLSHWIGEQYFISKPLSFFYKRQQPTCSLYTDKKENKTFLIKKENQNGAVAKSYMTSGLLIYGEIFAHFLMY